jgi:anti-sigma regulatory factor (Ser/Thr protein kinase)
MAYVITQHFQTNPVLQRIVRKQVAAVAIAMGALGDDAGRLELAVGEALANAHEHGYGGTAGPIELEIVYEQKRLAITIHDEGEGLPFEPRLPDPPDPRTGNGYGLQVIKGLMDEVGLQHPGPKGRGTTIRMAIRLP